jgi:carbohydrate kinase (thermoresistant glucokinase family)
MTMIPPAAVIVMGVAGSGKTTTAAKLGERLGWPFRDADSFHPEANIHKMSRGEALTDDDRWPWLDAIGSWIDERLAAGDRVVVTCSALKRAYRDVLMRNRPQARLVHLVGSRELIAGRMQARTSHFMPLQLLDSQFATLEPPGPDEYVVTVPVTLDRDAVVDRIIAALGLEPQAGR